VELSNGPISEQRIRGLPTVRAGAQFGCPGISREDLIRELVAWPSPFVSVYGIRGRWAVELRPIPTTPPCCTQSPEGFCPWPALPVASLERKMDSTNRGGSAHEVANESRKGSAGTTQIGDGYIEECEVRLVEGVPALKYSIGC